MRLFVACIRRFPMNRAANRSFKHATRYTSCTCPRERCAGEKQDEPDVKMAYVRRWTHSTEKNLSRAARD